jgi:hypothetical protein
MIGAAGGIHPVSLGWRYSRKDVAYSHDGFIGFGQNSRNISDKRTVGMRGEHKTYELLHRLGVCSSDVYRRQASQQRH